MRSILHERRGCMYTIRLVLDIFIQGLETYELSKTITQARLGLTKTGSWLVVLFGWKRASPRKWIVTQTSSASLATTWLISDCRDNATAVVTEGTSLLTESGITF